ncbi:MAG: peptidyl-prolyl cis-trans isomerase [Gemmataceae bacterium]|nr:peptidyl-prolyl cis-trans isomerase [Gemmataceae bacterium]
MSQGRLAAGGIALVVLLTGCATVREGLVELDGPLSADLTREAAPRLARLQQGDKETGRPPVLPPPPLPGTQQASLTAAAKSVRVSVRAYVNGKPLFDEEVIQMIPRGAWRDLQTMSEPQRSERLAEAYNQTLDKLIDMEVAYQDAVKRLEKINPRALDKLKGIAQQEYDKQLKTIRESKGIPEDQLREMENLLKRQMERELISTEYMRSRIFPNLQSVIGPTEVKEYYDTHLNEFQKVDTVKWQDVFIAVGTKHPTVADARRVAEALIAQCRTADDFAKLIEYDEGDSKFRGGEGLGSRRGEIRPPEVEDVLFRLREGEIGPVVEMSTGVHIVRVLKRERAGLVPLDDKTQNLIRAKLRNQLAEREYRRIVRELRARSVIEIEQEGIQ